MEDWTGQLVVGYRLRERLGEGQHGVVYRAFHTAEHTDVAFRVLADHLSQHRTVLARFQELAERSAALEHPGIVRVIQHGSWQERAFLVMEFIEGPSLRQVIEQTRGELGWADIVQIGRQIANSLTYAHEQQMLHLGLRPENVLLGHEQTGYKAMITDLGMSTLSEASFGQGGRTDDPQVLAYLSPEQCVASPVSAKTDVYALGIMLYELAAGQTPFRTPTVEQAVSMHMKTEPRMVSQHRIDVPSEVESLVMAMLSKQSRDRPELKDVAKQLQSVRRRLNLKRGGSWEEFVAPVLAARRPRLKREPRAPEPELAPEPSTARAQLHISRRGERTQVVPLEDRGRILIGRDSKCDVVLDDRRVSRRHCEVRWEHEQATVTDLGSNNGTFLGSIKLIPRQPEAMRPGSAIRIPPYTMRLEVIEPSGAQAKAPPRGAEAAPAAIGRDVSVRPDQDEVQVTPGSSPATLVVHLQNMTRIVDHFSLRVFGIPGNWVTEPAHPVQLNPRQEGSATLTFHPPPEPNTTAGPHAIQLLVHSREHDAVVGKADVVLSVDSFSRFEADLSPKQVETRTRADLQVTVANQGNTPASYTVMAADDAQALMFEIEPDEMELAPAASETAKVTAAPRKPFWIGKVQPYSFQVTVTSGTAAPQALRAQFRQRAWLPAWLPIMLMLLCCGLAALAAIAGPEAYGLAFPSPTPTATPPFTPTPTATSTPTPTPNVTATWEALDSDGDGLSNGEEVNIYRTDPLRPDTDADQLTDGDEVLKYRTDPLDNDTDDDTWLDGEEVQRSLQVFGEGSIVCPSPGNRDSDGDGIDDRVDEDPCNLPPTETPTVTPVPSFAIGGQINSNDHLDKAKAAGMKWIKKQIRYGPGDAAMALAEDINTWRTQDFKILLSVVGHKEDLAHGPGYYDQYAQFVGGLAEMGVDAIEIWNEMNLDREWPTGQINPNDYVNLLGRASLAIRAQGTGTLIVSGAPSPTGYDDGVTAWADKRYLEGMAQAGASQHIDCIGIHYNEGIIAPSETTGDPRTTDHYTRYFWGMVNTYWDAFGGSKPLCFTELGYLSPVGYAPLPSNFIWAQDTSVDEHARWLGEAVTLSRASGKVKLAIIWNLDFETYSGDDPQAGYAIIRADDSCPACSKLLEAVSP